MRTNAMIRATYHTTGDKIVANTYGTQGMGDGDVMPLKRLCICIVIDDVGQAYVGYGADRDVAERDAGRQCTYVGNVPERPAPK